MMIVRVLLFVTLAVRGLDCVRFDGAWSSPMNFFYRDTDVLAINIELQHVPPRTTDYIIFVQIENCDSNTEQYKQQGSSCIEPEKNGTIQIGELIKVSKKLTEPSVTLYIELRISNNICSRKKIIEGIMDEHADANAFYNNCLNKHKRPCQMNVDFGGKCEDKISCRPYRGNFTCESTNEELPEDTVHQWYQRYSDDSLIGYIPPVKGIKTKFKIELQNFDFTTYIYSILKSTQWKKDSNTEVVKIPLTTNGYKEYHVSRSQSYSENKQITFTCPNKTQHTQIGWIDPTGYKITTYNVTSDTKSFMKIDNNSMLCCLHFNTYTNGYEATVERSVDDITVLIYMQPEKQENVPTDTPHKERNSQDTSSLEPKAPRNITSAEASKDLSVGPSDNTKYYIAIVSVAGIILLIWLIYLVIKKCYRKSSDPEQTLQLETYASTNAVLYAELDISPGNAPPPVSAEDPTYAVIIGEIRPQNKCDKK